MHRLYNQQRMHRSILTMIVFSPVETVHAPSLRFFMHIILQKSRNIDFVYLFYHHVKEQTGW